MTLGQKLYELRTQKGLSQLELAEALDVSRQSVSKWETDAAVPEIDKLIAISRYFGVSIGALLGVEEETADAPEQGGELTDAQLKMVEEIVDRYVAALPKPMPKKQKLALKLCASMVLLGIVLLLAGQARHLQRLDDNYSNLRYSIDDVTRNVSGQINGITNRVQSALEEQARVTADYGAEFVSADLAANSATFAVSVTPKNFTDGMTAVFEGVSGGERVTLGPIEPEGLGFASELTVPLSDDVSLYASFGADGQRETQLLARMSGLYSATLPEVDLRNISVYGGMDNIFRTDAASNAVVYLLPFEQRGEEDGELSRAAVRSMEVGLFYGRKLVRWAEPSDPPPDRGTVAGQQCWRFDHFWLDALAATEGDYAFAARVTDEYGRVFMVEAPFYMEHDNAFHFAVDRYDASAADPDNWDFTPSA